jgi:hypothetical protein
VLVEEAVSPPDTRSVRVTGDSHRTSQNHMPILPRRREISRVVACLWQNDKSVVATIPGRGFMSMFRVRVGRGLRRTAAVFGRRRSRPH